MNPDMTIIYNHVRSKNSEGEIVTYSTMIRDKVISRSNPTVFKTMNEMLSQGTLRGEYMKSDSGHSHLALFAGKGHDDTVKDLIKNLTAEVIRMRMSLDEFMTGETERTKQVAVWHSLSDYDPNTKNT